jgi:hypothetical protein
MLGERASGTDEASGVVAANREALKRAAIGKPAIRAPGSAMRISRPVSGMLVSALLASGDTPTIFAATNKRPRTPSDANPRLTYCFSVTSGYFWTQWDGDLAPLAVLK